VIAGWDTLATTVVSTLMSVRLHAVSMEQHVMISLMDTTVTVLLVSRVLTVRKTLMNAPHHLVSMVPHVKIK
jgi:hypothetical protein